MLLFCKHDRVKCFLNEHYYFWLFVVDIFRENCSLTGYFKTKGSLRNTKPGPRILHCLKNIGGYYVAKETAL